MIFLQNIFYLKKKIKNFHMTKQKQQQSNSIILHPDAGFYSN